MQSGSPPSDKGRTSLSPADIRHNVLMLVLIDSIWVFGAAEMQLASGPLYVHLNASNTMIGLIGSLQMLGLFGILLSPFITRHFPIKKYYLFLVHLPYLAPWGAIGIALVSANHFGLGNEWLMTFIACMFGVSWFFAGFVTLPHNEYVAACVPMSHRGRLSGYANTAGGALALISNALAGWILYHLSKPGAFGWLFIMTWVICQSGYILALFGREQRTPVENAPPPWSASMLRAVIADSRYLRVIALNSVYAVLFYPTITTFISIYGFRELHMIPATAAVIGICQKGSQILLGAKIGRMIDRYSPKRALLFLPVSFALTMLPILVWKSPLAVYVSAALGASFTICFSAAFNALLFGLPRPENRAGHYTIQILCNYAALGCGQLAIGIMCDKIGYKFSFAALACLAIVMVPVSKKILQPLSEKSEHYH
ncbi:hypothetical protein OPIT5_27665 [Opitutaceae bacterium TAV5]|nr:hypothetical protein OPIT5_27665 [Opitutaceae bacterium TAV5]